MSSTPNMAGQKAALGKRVAQGLASFIFAVKFSMSSIPRPDGKKKTASFDVNLSHLPLPRFQFNYRLIPIHFFSISPIQENIHIHQHRNNCIMAQNIDLVLICSTRSGNKCQTTRKPEISMQPKRQKTLSPKSEGAIFSPPPQVAIKIIFKSRVPPPKAQCSLSRHLQLALFYQSLHELQCCRWTDCCQSYLSYNGTGGGFGGERLVTYRFNTFFAVVLQMKRPSVAIFFYLDILLLSARLFNKGAVVPFAGENHLLELYFGICKA